jgi:hypothetical protein
VGVKITSQRPKYHMRKSWDSPQGEWEDSVGVSEAWDDP